MRLNFCFYSAALDNMAAHALLNCRAVYKYTKAPHKSCEVLFNRCGWSALLLDFKERVVMKGIILQIGVVFIRIFFARDLNKLAFALELMLVRISLGDLFKSIKRLL